MTGCYFRIKNVTLTAVEELWGRAESKKRGKLLGYGGSPKKSAKSEKEWVVVMGLINQAWSTRALRIWTRWVFRWKLIGPCGCRWENEIGSSVWESAAFTGEIESPKQRELDCRGQWFWTWAVWWNHLEYFKKYLCLTFLAPLTSPPPLYTQPNILIYLFWSVVWAVSFKTLPR